MELQYTLHVIKINKLNHIVKNINFNVHLTVTIHI